MLLAENLRNAGCRQKIGFFLHIPWPALEVLLALPMHRHVVKALCSYDLVGFQTRGDLLRSEEHTSELQSLMRISYAVFCLKKKTTHTVETRIAIRYLT